jgi:hypothetical protein
MVRAGEKTGKFGKWVVEYCKDHFPELKVYYDHGNKEEDEDHVKVPMGHYGEEVRRRTRITDCDILVGLPGEPTGEAVLLIEVEQGSASKTSGKRSVSPKTVMGDVIATMLCDGFAIKKEDYQKGEDPHEKYIITDKTALLIAFPYNDKGYSKDKMEELEDRIKAIQDSNLELEFVMHPDLDELLCSQLKDKVIQILSKYKTRDNIVYIGGTQRDTPPK